ncbi:MAG TPA: helix-turn-helix transcriptional regulator [Pseudonocardia sp.]|jgi:transcriptional regulator with XRE-family HTH domain
MTDTNERTAVEPVTTVIAQRVRELRSSRGMSQAELAQAMVAAGRIKWTRATVGNLERRAPTNSRATGAETGRDAVSVQELLALARSLRVPPVALLVNPGGGPTPVVDGVDTDAGSALLWIIGKQPLDDHGYPDGAWTTAATMIERLWQIATLVDLLERSSSRGALTEMALGERFDTESHDRADRSLVTGLAAYLKELVAAGMTPPPMPEFVLHRAQQLGVDLGIES